MACGVFAPQVHPHVRRRRWHVILMFGKTGVSRTRARAGFPNSYMGINDPETLCLIMGKLICL